MTVTNTAPADESAARLQDLVGNAAASFSGQDVTINTTPLTTSVSAVPNSHVGSSTFTFELRGIFKKCVNSQAVYPLSEQHGLEAQERR